MLINHETIKIPANYVLVKIDDDFSKYHLDGKETSIYIGTSAMKDLDENSLLEDKKETVFSADHWADTGVIVKSPAKYTFKLDEIERLKNHRGSSLNENDVDNINCLKTSSLKFVTHDEFHCNQRIKFNYACRMTSVVIPTEIGELLLIHCNDIEAVFDESGMLHPVNGNVFFELIQPKRSHLDVNASDKRIWDLNGIQKGIVYSLGNPIKRFIEEPDFVDETVDLKKGDVIYFKSYNAYNIESENHFFIFGGKEILCINRYNILATE
jgi:co-chaperonin GroES (HSP10)